MVMYIDEVNVIGLSLQAAPYVPGLAMFRPPLIVPGLNYDLNMNESTTTTPASTVANASQQLVADDGGGGVANNNFLNNFNATAAEEKKGNY